MKKVAFISGHLDLTFEEFIEHYANKIMFAINAGYNFIVGDARGADRMAMDFIKSAEFSNLADRLTIYHMFESPRNSVEGATLKGGFQSDDERDSAMTQASDYDIAWVREGREKSGTQKNLDRR